MKSDGTVQVLNQCRKGSLTGPWKAALGTATIPDPNEPAKLKVRFKFDPWAANYWIFEVDPNY